MEFACFTRWEELPESAAALFLAAEQESVFFSRPWLENLSDQGLESGQSLLLACVLKHQEVLALLPLMGSHEGYWRSLGHLYSSLFTLLMTETDRQDVLACLVDGLKQLPLYSLRLEPLAENDANLRDFQRVMESSGFSCHRHFRFYNWLHPLREASFDAYMAARPSRVRNTIARKQRKLQREHDYRIKLYTSVEDLQQGIADYSAAYTASWKVNEVFPDLVKGIATSFARAGWLRLAVLYIDNQPAAAQFWFVAHRKASIFKLAYDEKWRQYSPGSILIAYLMQQVIDVDKVTEIDFLTGNDAYKQDWMTERRERCGILFANSSYAQPRNKVNFIETLKVWIKRRYNLLTYKT